MKPFSEYPRPQLVRDSYICLNGEWEYAIRDKKDIPSSFDGKILVPYSPETPLSGVNRLVHPNEWLFYRTNLEFPKSFIKDKVILHFGAVDQIAEVFYNGKLIQKHAGGFLPFEFDIKPYINSRGPNELIVRVRDYTDTSFYSRGKQKLKKGGIWYSPQSGIYMPVWMESVTNDYVKSLKITPDIDKSLVIIKVVSKCKKATLTLGNIKYQIECNKEVEIPIKNRHLWTPEDPYLYPFTVKTEKDKISSYFAMRKISTFKDNDGYRKIALNNQPYFMKGVLDQGYYKEGFLTPKSDEDYINDIQLVKSLGFNTARKHIKIESLRWYYHCDRLGLLVWQDFVNGGAEYSIPTIVFPLILNIHSKDNKYAKFARANANGRAMAEDEFIETVNLLYNCPCIVLWTIFNEGWGQFDSARIYEDMKKIDNTRLYDHASGWHDQGVSDTKSLHVYFKRVKMPRAGQVKDRAVILSEAGGYELKIKGHCTKHNKSIYRSLRNSKALENEYHKFIERDILPNIPLGLSAFIYTQLSDVEDESNGFITYDRAKVKINPEIIKRDNERVKY